MQNYGLGNMILSAIYTTGSSSSNFLRENRLLLIIIYIIFVVSMIVWLQYTHKTMISADKAYNAIIDPLRYQTSSLLYSERNNIHDVQNTIPLLLHNKTSYTKDNIPYRSVSDKIIEEIKYIANLTGKEITIDQDKIKKVSSFCQTLHATEGRIKGTLSLLTLGISRLFIA